MPLDEKHKSKAELIAEVRQLREALQTGRQAGGVVSQEADQRFRLMAEMTSYGVWMSSPDGWLMYASQTFLDLLGVPLEVALGDGWMSRLPSDDAERVKREWQHCIQTGERWDSDFRVMGPDGQYRTILVRGGPALDKDGNITCWVGINLDITQRKHEETEVIAGRQQAQASLRDSDERFRLLVSGVRDYAIVMLDPEGRVVSWNEGARSITGYEANEMMGQSFARLCTPDDIKGGQPQRELDVAAAKGRFEEERCRVRKNGSPFWVNIVTTALRDEAGRLRGFATILRDITERRRLEMERADLLRREQQARADAECANRRKDQFLAVLSHELRTPLTPVIGLTEIMKLEPNLSPEMREAIDTIAHNVQLEARLIDDLLDITRLATGQLRLNEQQVEVHEKVREAWHLCQQDAEAKQLRVTLDLRASRHHIHGDPFRLQQVFWNLIGNAVKYTPTGGSIAIRTRNTDDGSVQIEVSDSGIGIEADLMGRIFDPFEQGERTLSRRFGGLGLGLSISKSLVEMHKGTLRAVSEGTGKGATFTVELKTVAGHAGRPSAGSSSLGKSHQRSLNILLVEDNEDTLRVLSRLLQTFGHRVTTATSIQSALSVVADHPFDLLISDIGLPDGTGWELMRAIGASRPIRGIALSGYVQQQDIDRSKAVGFLEHLAKPIDPQRLSSLIQRVAM